MPKLVTLVLIVLVFPMFSQSQARPDGTPAAATSKIELDVSPLTSQLAPPDALPPLGIHRPGRGPKGVSREERLELAARWLKAAAGVQPIIIEIPNAGYTLNVTGNPQTLQQLKDAINQINPPGRPQVVFDCRLFTMSTEAIQKVDENLRKKILAAMVPGSVHAESVTDEEREALTKACTSRISAPRLIMNDGESAYALISTDRPYVANVTKIPAKAPTSQPSFEPEIGLVSSGVAVGAKVDVKLEDKTIAVQVKTMVTKLLELKTALADPEDKQTHIQVPTLENYRFEQLCSVVDGESLLCHGERELINGPTTQPTGDDVFFIISCSIALPKK